FLVVAARAHDSLTLQPSEPPTEQTRRGNFLIAVATLLMAYAVTQGEVMMAAMGVLLAVALVVGSLLPHGIAHASRTWGLRHWVALAWGSAVIWASALLNGMTSFFTDVWFVLTVVIVAPGPLLVINGIDSRRTRGVPASGAEA
ncbi:MAG: hypothetical protein ACK5LS_00550, partial [Propioniciclava sp.]